MRGVRWKGPVWFLMDLRIIFFQFERPSTKIFLVGGWTNPFENNMLVKLDHDFPKHPGWKIQKIFYKNHHPDLVKNRSYPKNQRQKTLQWFQVFSLPTKSIQVTITDAGPKFRQVLRAIGKTILIPGKIKGWRVDDAFVGNGRKAIFIDCI